MTDAEMKAKADKIARQAHMVHSRYGQLRKGLTEIEKVEALRIGRIEFKSAGATRKR